MHRPCTASSSSLLAIRVSVVAMQAKWLRNLDVGQRSACISDQLQAANNTDAHLFIFICLPFYYLSAGEMKALQRDLNYRKF